MTKIILFTRPDGGVSVLNLTPETLSKFETEDEAIDYVRRKDVPDDATKVRVIDKSAIPAKRTFRDAWIDGTDKAVTDRSKASAIHMNRIREVRNAELAKEDINFQKAIEADDASAKTAVATKKQTLRDLPATFDLSGASTDDELDALWPSELPERA
jgi:hypothetical protein